MERGQQVWQKYYYLKRESRVVRSGFGLYGVYDYDPEQPFDGARSESDLEHTAGMTALTTLTSLYYPELIPPAELSLYLAAAQLHEIGEVELGDLPDDGTRNEQQKCQAERAAVERYVRDLPAPFGAELAMFFIEFQHRSTRRGRILYGLDKLEAVLQGLIYEREGRGGHSLNKSRRRKLSAQDRQNIADTGSPKLADIWAVHFMERILATPEEPVFLEVLEAAVRDVRGEWFPWAQQWRQQKIGAVSSGSEGSLKVETSECGVKGLPKIEASDRPPPQKARGSECPPWSLAPREV